jgi:hypothetical protein
MADKKTLMEEMDAITNALFNQLLKKLEELKELEDDLAAMEAKEAFNEMMRREAENFMQQCQPHCDCAHCEGKAVIHGLSAAATC